jgi:hypothetical protein
LYLLMIVGMGMLGAQIAQGGNRHRGTEVSLALAFSLVLFMIADLDRPQEGLINVSQQALIDLQTKMHAP